MSHLKDFVFGSAFAVMVVVFGVSVGPELEGSLLPVFDEITIKRLETASEDSVRVWGSGRKIRAHCEYKGIEWNVGDTITSADAPVIIEERSKARSSGNFDFGPWVIKVKLDDFERNSFSYTYHKCHPFYLTKTKFYPSEAVVKLLHN